MLFTVLECLEGNADGTLNKRTDHQPTQHRNHHPTVKPIDLMRWLCRLVTPLGGTILDPFTGSGSTGYVEIAKARIEWWARFPLGTEVEDALESGRREIEARDAGQLALGF